MDFSELFLLFLILGTPIALLIAILAMSVTNSSKIKKLEARFSALREELEKQGLRMPEEPVVVKAPPRAAPTRPAPARREASRPAVASAVSPPPVAEPQPVEAAFAAPPLELTPEPVAAAAPAEKGAPATPKPPKAARSNEEWETLIGGKWLNRIGAFALILGMVFFLKYAFDNDLISEWGRVLIGAGVGAVLLFGGWRLEKKDMLIFAQGLVGTGLSIFYITVYASFNFYHLVPQWVAFLLMSGVTVLTFAQAFRYDSVVVSILGWAGGFITPFVLRTGQVNELGLFTYVLVLAVGLLAVVMRKDKWVVLEPLTLAAVYLTYSVWFSTSYKDGDFLMTLGFATAFWMLFLGVELYRTVRNQKTYSVLRHIVAAGNALFFLIALIALLDQTYDDWTGRVVYILGGVYVLIALGIYAASGRTKERMHRLLLTATTVISVGSAIECEGYILVIAWALQAGVLIYVGLQARLRYMWVIGLSLGLIAFFAHLFNNAALGIMWYRAQDIPFLMSERSAAYLSIIAAFFLGAWMLRRLEPERKVLQGFVHIGWAAVLFLFCTVETNDYFVRSGHGAADDIRTVYTFLSFLAVSIVWILLALGIAWTGLTRKVAALYGLGLVFAGMAAFMIMFAGFSFRPVEQYHLLLNQRTLAYLIVISGLSGLYFMIARQGAWSKTRKGMVDATIITALTVLLVGLSAEINDFFRLQMTHAWGTDGLQYSQNIERLSDQRHLSLSLMWLVYSIVLMGYGFLRKRRLHRILAFILFGASILKIFIYDLSSLDTLYRIFSFVALGLILMIVSYVYLRYKDVLFGESAEKPNPAGS